MSASNPLGFLDKFPPYPGEELASWTGANFIVSRGYWGAYEWLVVVGAFASFTMAWGIGANDVANAFGTSVGAKTITLWQACIIAAIFEFTGAMVLGGEVAKTVAGSITSPSYFQQVPEVFAFGMLTALVSASVILAVATYLSAAISTTHSIIGAVLGFGLIYGGSEAIVWNEKIDEFPYRKGLVTVFMSWAIAPTMAGILSAIIFLFNRHVILRRKNSVEWAFWSFPVLVYITVFINLLFVLMKGAGKELKWDKEGKKAAWVSALAALGAAFLMIPVVFYLKKRLAKKLAEAEAAAQDTEAAAKAKELEGTPAGSEDTTPRTGIMGLYDRAKKQITYSLTLDIHEDVYKDAAVAAMHANAEVFDPKTEEVYKYLQVFSACCVSFAHGANDVANAIGPFAGIWAVYRTYKVASEAETPHWMLALGGAGIVVGLATYGYNIMKVLGVQLATMTPCRGFSAELATSLTISIATVYGLPVSTTQTIVGAEAGVGICESLKMTGMNWKLFLRTCFGWVISFGLSTLFSCVLFSFCLYSPSLTDLDYVNSWQNAMTQVMNTELTVLNNTAAFPNVDNKMVANLAKNLTSMNDFKKFGKTNMYDMMSVFKNVTFLYVNNTMPPLA